MHYEKRKFSCMRDGLTIRGLEYRTEGENLPVAIVSHGFMANHKTCIAICKFFAEMGYAAYTFVAVV